MRQTVIALAALMAFAVLDAPTSEAGVTCSAFPSWCSPGSNQSGGGRHSIPEPGTLGLLVVGAAAGLYRVRRGLKKKD